MNNSEVKILYCLVFFSLFAFMLNWVGRTDALLMIIADILSYILLVINRIYNKIEK